MELEVFEEIHQQCHTLLDEGYRVDVCLLCESHRARFINELGALTGLVPPFTAYSVPSITLLAAPCPALSGLLVRFIPDERCLAPISVCQIERLTSQPV